MSASKVIQAKKDILKFIKEKGFTITQHTEKISVEMSYVYIKIFMPFDKFLMFGDREKIMSMGATQVDDSGTIIIDSFYIK